MEDLNAHELKKENFEATLLENKLAIKLNTYYVLCLKGILLSLETMKGFLMKINEQLISCPLQTTTSGSLVTYKIVFWKYSAFSLKTIVQC